MPRKRKTKTRLQKIMDLDWTSIQLSVLYALFFTLAFKFHKHVEKYDKHHHFVTSINKGHYISKPVHTKKEIFKEYNRVLKLLKKYQKRSY